MNSAAEFTLFWLPIGMRWVALVRMLSGGTGAPTTAPALAGLWYADLAAGQAYKACRGVLQKIAEQRARHWLALHAARAQLLALSLPDEPAPASPAVPVGP